MSIDDATSEGLTPAHSKVEPTPPSPRYSHDTRVAGPTHFDVFNQLVEAEDDFLGLLAYSLYKRHKIEWIQSQDGNNPDTFKQMACTAQQVRMYRDQAEQLAKNFIDETMNQLGAELKETVTNSVVIAKIESLKPGFWRSLGNHTLSGIASVAVALALFGLFTLYASYQENGGLEGRLRQMNEAAVSAPSHP